MDELKAIQEIIEKTNTTQAIIISCILIIFLVISKIIDAKTKKNQIVLSDKLASLVDVLAAQFKRQEVIDREKCRTIIVLGFESLYNNLYSKGQEIIIENNVNSKSEFIIPTIESTVNAEYYKLYNILYPFEVSSRRINIYLKEDWKREIIDTMVKVIFSNSLNNQDKLDTLSTKLSVMISNYSTYVHNKTFNE